jgi:carbon monoxide dehydrogenase subunit G
VGDDLQVTYDTHISAPSGLVVAVGALHDRTPPAVHQVPIDSPSGTITIPSAGAKAAQTVHVSVAAADGSGSPATMTHAGAN